MIDRTAYDVLGRQATMDARLSSIYRSIDRAITRAYLPLIRYHVMCDKVRRTQFDGMTAS